MITSLLALLSFLIVNNPGGLLPGLDGVQEGATATVQIGEANTTGIAQVALLGDYASAPIVATSAEITAQSGGAAAATVDRVEVVARTATQVDVEVQLSAAPGAGETTDVRVDVIAQQLRW